jgi:crotonobetainyl-CoA:carnitine CoA-transferase CaiB-like acyl-CoA transferase
VAESEKYQIFSGLRVLELTQYIAGPMMGKLMADLGADVIKIDVAPRGYMMRYYGRRAGRAPSSSVKTVARTVFVST